MDSCSLEFASKKGLARDDDWSLAFNEVEVLVGSTEPLVAPPKKRHPRLTGIRSLARPLGWSLFLAFAIALVLALYPSQPDASSAQGWQTARQ